VDGAGDPRPSRSGRQLPAALADDRATADADAEPARRPSLEALDERPERDRPHPEAGVTTGAGGRPIRSRGPKVQANVAPDGAGRIVERGPDDVRRRIHKEPSLDRASREG
jgi:hypothetical protein